MDIPNNYPPDSKGWHGIEGLKWWIKWEATIATVAHREDAPEKFAEDATPVMKDLIADKNLEELEEIVENLTALRGTITDLIPLITGYMIIAQLEALAKRASDPTDDIFSRCRNDK